MRTVGLSLITISPLRVRRAFDCQSAFSPGGQFPWSRLLNAGRRAFQTAANLGVQGGVLFGGRPAKMLGAFQHSNPPLQLDRENSNVRQSAGLARQGSSPLALSHRVMTKSN